MYKVNFTKKNLLLFCLVANGVTWKPVKSVHSESTRIDLVSTVRV